MKYKKIICIILDHKWRWTKIGEEFYVERCKRCGLVYQPKPFHISLEAR